MNIKKTGFLLGAFAYAAVLFADNTRELKLSSPDGVQQVGFYQRQTAPAVNGLFYRVSFKGQPVIEESRAGLELDNRIWEMALGQRKLIQPACWMDNLEVDSVTYAPTVDNTWKPLYGERSKVRDRYNAATLHLSKKDGSFYRLDIEVRAYDEGIAFRYFFPEHPRATFHKVVGDLTEYTLPAGTKAWSEQWAQAFFITYIPMVIKHIFLYSPCFMRQQQPAYHNLPSLEHTDNCVAKMASSACDNI